MFLWSPDSPKGTSLTQNFLSGMNKMGNTLIGCNYDNRPTELGSSKDPIPWWVSSEAGFLRLQGLHLQVGSSSGPHSALEFNIHTHLSGDIFLEMREGHPVNHLSLWLHFLDIIQGWLSTLESHQVLESALQDCFKELHWHDCSASSSIV